MGITEELRHTAAKLVSAAKFALGSALSQVGLKSGSAAAAAAELSNLVMVEEMKVQQDMNTNNRSRDDDDHLKRLFDEPLNDATPQPQPQPQRKIFIRSRL